MKNNHNFGQQIIIYIFLVSLVFQSCFNLTDLPIPQEEYQVDNSEVSVKKLTDTKSKEKEEHEDTYAKQVGQFQTAEGINLTQLAGSKEAQKQLIHENLPKRQQSGYVYVSHLGLKGGGKEGEEKGKEGKEQKKRKETEGEKKPEVVKQRRIEEKGAEHLKEGEVANLSEEEQKQLIHGSLLRGEAEGMLSLPGYQLANCLHKGISSNIYRAVRLADGQPVVIKFSNQKALSEKKIQRFRREFELGQQIDSPHVIRYLELREDLAYGIALVMEDAQAVELTSFIPPEGFSELEFLEMAIQIVQGLQAIHSANIVHNDLKPSNILIQPTTRQIKIIDLNYSSTVRQERQPATPIRAVGALAYISPEQTGRINRSIDYRTDFYALGVTFYQLLCGQLPFRANDALGFIHQHLAKQPLPPHQIKPTIALPLSRMVMRLLEKEAEKRYQSCEGILHDLSICQSALKETGTIPDFKLGQQDFSNKLTLSQHVYGRESEVKALMHTFEQVSQGSREVMVVAGQPGVGKTMLIQEIQKPVTLKSGYFLTGKFDQLKKNVAYSALTQAFNSLVMQWLAEDETRIAQWKAKLLTALGSQVSLLTKVVPALSLLIGEQPEPVITDISQAKNVFNWVFQEFVKVCATPTHPLVIFLDDLQWAGQASLDLMSYLMQQPNISHLLWIGAYRDTEVTTSHPALQAFATLQEAGVNVQTLTLTPLPLHSLCQWIADSLRKTLTDVQPLAELVYQKTAGNPFFVKLFLQSLYDQQLLCFSPHIHWEWDLAKIRQHPATENVITLMTYQIQQFPASTQQALNIASCLGHRLALSTLQTAMACSSEAVNEALQPALNSGILIRANNEVYFTHDRVQEAAYGLIREAARAHTHLMIGQRLLASPSGEEGLLLDIVTQFNSCRSLITDLQERYRIAQLNLKAGQRAKQATAYSTALDYLHSSQVWIRDTNALWQTNYSLAFTLFKELAEVEFLSAHFERSEALIKDIQPRLQSTLDQVEIYHLLIIQKVMQGQHQEAITLGHQALQLLGSGLPLDNLSEFIEKTAADIKKKLRNRPLSSLLDLPLVVDPEKQAIFKILASIYGASYHIGSDLYPAIVFMSTNLSLSYGHTPESCHSYAAYGLLLCARFEDYALGYQFGHLALQLAEKLKSPARKGQSLMVVLSCIYPWSKSIHQLPALLSEAYESCLTGGDIEYAGYCAMLKVQMLFYQGCTLAKVQQDLLHLLQFAYNTKNQMAANAIQAVHKLLANLVGSTPDKGNFDTNEINEAQFVEACQQSNSFQALCFYHILRAQAFYTYGNFTEAFDQLALAKQGLDCILGQYATTNFNWYDSLTRLALYPKLSSEEQQVYLQQVIQNQQQMQKWQASCPENFAHKYLLVEAELARLQGHSKQAKAYYEKAIELAERHGFIQEQALAAELAAKYWLAKDQSRCAQGYLNTAFNGYKQWGAKHKLRQFEVEHASLLHAIAPLGLSPLNINHETTLSSGTLKFLDLSSILKASHAISSEIELPKLLRSMMQIVVENAGAQQGTLFLVEADGSIVVQAEYASDGTITTLQKMPLDNWANGAQGVIEFVKQSHQPLVIENAATDERFKNDSYIQRTQAKSILCVPLLKHTELRAILYVENDLMTHTFTPERVQTVMILATQMAISLENATLYESIRSVTGRLKLALKSGNVGTWIWNIQDNKLIWDEAMYTLYGVKKDTFELTYGNFVAAIHPDDRTYVTQAIKRALEMGVPYEVEFRVIHPEDKSVHYLTGRGEVYRDANGRPERLVGVNSDITQRKQLEEERFQALKRAKEEEERHRKEQEEFIDTMCHEIRNPMTGVFGHIDYLSEAIISLNRIRETLPLEVQPSLTELIQKLEESTHTIKKCMEHQKAIVNDVLDISKLEAGKLVLAAKLFQPKTVIEETIPLFATQLAAKNLELKICLPETAITVQGDVDRFKIILINLISNALKFTEKGYIKISLQTRDVDATHVALTLSVEDTGVGMTPEEQSRLFQRFSRPLSSQYEGSGLGLVITQKSLKLMGGDIQVESEKGRGSRFTCHLTCQTVPAEATISPEISLPPTTTQSTPVSGYILVVEDNLMNQKILKRQMEQAGHRCAVANNGQEALKQCEQMSFDLILMDMEMPVMGGLEATRNIRAREKQEGMAETPIIGLSAYTRPEYKEEALEAGMNDYVTKPYEKEKIFAAIQRLLK